MSYATLLGSALWALFANKLRSLLTVPGITIGIAAVICVVAIGRAGHAQVERQLNNLGDNFVWIEAGGRAVNVVTYDAIIDFANPELKLFPGMTAYVTIPVAPVENVVKLPNASLHFKPPLAPAAVQVLFARYGVEGGRWAAAPAGATPGVAIASEPHSRASGSRDSTVQPRGDRAIVWKLLADNTIVPVEVALGITDHAYTEVTAVLAGDLRPGDDVVTTAVASKVTAPGAQGFRR